ncbi:MAG TPA: 4-hydroxy-tetrahydrodipicolinate synthase [Anaerolineae bacterium]|nr:4-hydroxy-tetrahydrodipicolinate synthase [Anaerolineae bacterium]
MNAENPLSLHGVFPPITTPFKQNGDIDFRHLATNLERWNRQPLTGYVVGGSNGEFVSLSSEERVDVVRAACEEAPPDRLVIAGSGMQSTRGTIELTNQMAEVGADAAIVVTPSYYKTMMSTTVLENHYRQIADASLIPILLYNVPANTGVELEIEAVVRLATHPNVIGIKESGGSVAKIGAMVHKTPEDFQVLAGSAGFMLAALEVGAVGVIAALANIAGKELVEILTQFYVGEHDAARAMQLRLIEANTAVTARYGIPGLKAAMDMLGYFGGPVRSPLLSLGEEEREPLRQILFEAGLLH